MALPKSKLNFQVSNSDPRILAAFPDLKVVGALDDIPEGPLEVAMTEDWMGYFGVAVMAKLNELHPERFTHVRLLPDSAANAVIVVPCDELDYGATEVKFSPTEATAVINLRLAMKVLKVSKLEDRVRIFSVISRGGADGKEYLAFVTKPSGSRPAKKLKSEEEEPSGGAGSGPTGSN